VLVSELIQLLEEMPEDATVVIDMTVTRDDDRFEDVADVKFVEGRVILEK
jgi:hypothetical protein